MKLLDITIENFRGIKYSSVTFSQNSRLVCLIGAGDSGKSTLLTAIEWVLWPSWNLIVSDVDFYNCDTSSSIKITASISEFSEELMKEDKYGLYLRDYDKMHRGGDDEPTDDGLKSITIQLTIDETLEPKWNVITNRTEPKPIGHKDRRLFSFGAVGFDNEKDFLWGRNSVLQKYANSRDELHSAYTQAMRTAVANTTFNDLDQAVSQFKEVGTQYGVGFNGYLRNKLLMQNSSYSTSVGVFDDCVPFAQRGLGSKRLLSIGLNVNAYDNGTLVLVDEIETGLEPYRISALINQFRSQFKDQGQIIMTTHSRSVVCESTVNEVAVCVNRNGQLNLHYFDVKNDLECNVQALLRESPDAFLCRRVIVCEGKTEVGLLRALDKYRNTMGKPRFAHFGVGVVLGGGGDKFFVLAQLLHECGYDVSILMDSDLPTEEPKKQEVRDRGIPVFDWEEGFAIEEQIFKDVSPDCINSLIAIAIGEKSSDHVIKKMSEEFSEEVPSYELCHEVVSILPFITQEERIRLGKVAKDNKWFKNISCGENIGDVIFQEFESMARCSFKDRIIALQDWVEQS
ncbi:MAG: AAA family ATPase [Thermoguttaceae bacterium]|nr:AAA family ATPase [Thermoguttaceae bacterium]